MVVIGPRTENPADTAAVSDKPSNQPQRGKPHGRSNFPSHTQLFGDKKSSKKKNDAGSQSQKEATESEVGSKGSKKSSKKKNAASGQSQEESTESDVGSNEKVYYLKGTFKSSRSRRSSCTIQ